MIGNSSIDTLNGGEGDDVLDGATGADFLNGGNGVDTVSYATRSAPVTADPDGLADDGQALELDTISSDVENLISGSDNDTLTGGSVDNILTGNDGVDTLNGGACVGPLDGGLRADTLSGGADIGTVSYAGRSALLTVTIDNVANDSEAGRTTTFASTFKNIVSGSSGRLADQKLGNNQADRRQRRRPAGMDRHDTLIGGAGVDASPTRPLSASDGRPRQVVDDGETGENDGRSGDIEDIIGGLAGDTLTGNAIANALTGGASNDTRGGEGSDVLLDAGDGLFAAATRSPTRSDAARTATP